MMLKFLGVSGFLISNLVFAWEKPVLTCNGTLESDTYALKVMRVTGLTGGVPESYVATLDKNGKLAKVTGIEAFDNGADKDYGYQNKENGLNVSITHLQLTDIPYPYVRGVIQIFVSDAWLNVRVKCNTKP